MSIQKQVHMEDDAEHDAVNEVGCRSFWTQSMLD
jgi:hypothetical protein